MTSREYLVKAALGAFLGVGGVFGFGQFFAGDAAHQIGGDVLVSPGPEHGIDDFFSRLSEGRGHDGSVTAQTPRRGEGKRCGLFALGGENQDECRANVVVFQTELAAHVAGEATG